MPKSRHLLSLLGGAGAAALAGLALPTAVGHAESTGDGPYETCDGAVCLVMADQDQGNWQYSGIRPLFTDWQADQPYNVVVNGDDGSAIDAGSYNVKIEDYWSPIIAVSQYHYGDFTPSADADSLDLGDFGGLSGADVYDASLFGGAIHQLTINNVTQHGHEMSYLVTSTNDFTNVLVTGGGATADYIQSGDGEPVFLWNSLFHDWLPEVPDHVVPGDPFAGLDFDPGDY